MTTWASRSESSAAAQRLEDAGKCHLRRPADGLGKPVRGRLAADEWRNADGRKSGRAYTSSTWPIISTSAISATACTTKISPAGARSTSPATPTCCWGSQTPGPRSAWRLARHFDGLKGRAKVKGEWRAYPNAGNQDFSSVRRIRAIRLIHSYDSLVTAGIFANPPNARHCSPVSSIPITEKLLLNAGGWQAMKPARELLKSGRVSEPKYEPPLLSGYVRDGGKNYRSGLRIKTAIDVENICSCWESRSAGKICAHSVAVGLCFLNPPAAIGSLANRAGDSGSSGRSAVRRYRDRRRSPNDIARDPAAQLCGRMAERSGHDCGGSGSLRKPHARLRTL